MEPFPGLRSFLYCSQQLALFVCPFHCFFRVGSVPLRLMYLMRASSCGPRDNHSELASDASKLVCCLRASS